jgi:FlaA1/EpsC-like NDP-sugar epimerase
MSNNILKKKGFFSNLFSRYLSKRYLSIRVVFILDLFLSTLSSLLVLFLAESVLKIQYESNSFILLCCILSFVFFGIASYITKSYKVIIRHSTLFDMFKILFSVILKELLFVLFLLLVPNNLGFLVNLYLVVFDFLLTFIILLTTRMLMLVVYYFVREHLGEKKDCINILVYGTSDRSIATLTRLGDSTLYKVVGFVSPNDFDLDKRISSHKIYHFRSQQEFNNTVIKLGLGGILFTSEIEAQKEQNGLIHMASEVGVKALLIPSIDTIEGSNLLHYRVREIKIEDLLGRSEIKLSLEKIKENLHNRCILVTGAAGSIGSELCRQLLGYGVSRIILFDNAETPVHNLRLELEDSCPGLNFIPVIGDVRNTKRLDYVFRKYRPSIVFHAAAYKHVPLMEENPCEAILVNVIGSKKVADKCIEYGVDKMIMISTDKAVNPTSIMGCSKRLAEIYVQSLGLAIKNGIVNGHTKFITTRFGNVLGSNGSVIPRFTAQIERGGPVTVTDPRITRYFMTISEACRLVMEASAISEGNQIVVFDMGKPVKIVDLARNMIELAGFVPNKDIQIIFTGLRPGEKLYEEVLSTSENTIPTSHELIKVARVRQYDYNDINTVFEQIKILANDVNIPDLVKLMKQTVPEFKSNNSDFEIYD